MWAFLGLACTRSFRPLHPLFCIHTEDRLGVLSWTRSTLRLQRSIRHSWNLPRSPKVPVTPVDKELSNLLRSRRADYRQASDRSCTKETLDVERLLGFLGENRRRRKATEEQLSRCQANSQRRRSGWELRCLQH